MRMHSFNRPRLETLEDRFTPASFNWSGFSNTLQITQTQGTIGTLGITDNVTSVTLLDAGDGSFATVSLLGFDNLTITLLGGDNSLIIYDLTADRPGNLTLNINNALPRFLSFDGGAAIAGSLSVTSGNGALTFSEAASLVVGANASFNGGFGPDIIDFSGGGPTIVGGNLMLTRFNGLTTGPGDVVGGMLSFNDNGEGQFNTLLMTNTVIGLDLNYFGGNRGDFIVLGGTSTVIGRNVTVNFSTQLPTDTSALVQAPGLGNIIGGNVNVQGGNIGTDIVLLSGVVAGSISINLANGTNTFVINGLIASTSVTYLGGAQVDTVLFAPLPGSARTRFFASLGAGNDVIAIVGGASNPSFATIDFGAGFDLFFGLINFPVSFFNLP